MKQNTSAIEINEFIRSPELRLIDQHGASHGVVATKKALILAKEVGLDLIVISPTAVPPVAKITDYGKFKYEKSKKEKEVRAKSHTTETKVVQIRVNTGDHDLELKAKKISEWVSAGDRVKIELFLKGRTKYMEALFLNERLERITKLISVSYKIAEGPKQGPKGPYLIIEKSK